jgi:exonuclease III
MEKSLRIVLWNANGLSNYNLELKNVLLTHKIDIVLISETQFTTKTVFKIPNYKVYHIPHPDGTVHGGAAITIRSAINYHKLLHHQSDKIQAANIQVDANTRPFTISAIYCPPRNVISAEKYIAFFQSLGPNFLTGGDWDVKHKEWGARLTTPKGRNRLYVVKDKIVIISVTANRRTGHQTQISCQTCWTFLYSTA